MSIWKSNLKVKLSPSFFIITFLNIQILVTKLHNFPRGLAEPLPGSITQCTVLPNACAVPISLAEYFNAHFRSQKMAAEREIAAEYRPWLDLGQGSNYLKSIKWVPADDWNPYQTSQFSINTLLTSILSNR